MKGEKVLASGNIVHWVLEPGPRPGDGAIRCRFDNPPAVEDVEEAHVLMNMLVPAGSSMREEGLVVGPLASQIVGARIAELLGREASN